MLHAGGGPPQDLAGGGAPSDRLGGRGPPMDQGPGGPHGMDRDNGGPSSFGVQPMGPPMHADEDTDTRFFIIRSSTDFNVEVSMQRGIWATIPRNETRLTQAVQEARSVVLFFRVQSSPSWSGYALMKNAPGQGSCPSSVFAGRSGRPFVGRTFDVEWIRKIPLSVEKTRNLFNRFNNGESVNRAMDGQPVDPEAGRALVYLFEEAFMAAGGGGPSSFNPIYGGGPLGAPPTQTPHLQMQSQGGGVGRQRGWQSQGMRAQDSSESQITRRQQQQPQSGGNGERKKQAGKRQEKSNASTNGTADGSLPTKAPSNPAMLVFPIVLTDMTYDAYISAYEESQALWQRVFKKHGFDVGEKEEEKEKEEEIINEEAALSSQMNESTEDISQITKTEKTENSKNSQAEERETIKETNNSFCGNSEKDFFSQIKIEKDD